MHIMFTDETNTRPAKDGKFFVYGGLFFPIEKLPKLHFKIEKIRAEVGYKSGDILKFDTRARPEHITIGKATEAKQKIVALCKDMGCKFIAHIILHDIIQNQDPVQQVRWAADYVIGRYHKYLMEVNDDGMVAVDNLPNGTEFKYLTDKFSSGLTLPGNERVSLERILLYTSTRIGASNVHSAMDIVLGSFRYVINNPANVEAATIMIKQVSDMMWAAEKDGVRYLGDRGLIVRPKLDGIRKEEYHNEYTELIKRLEELTNSE